MRRKAVFSTSTIYSAAVYRASFFVSYHCCPSWYSLLSFLRALKAEKVRIVSTSPPCLRPPHSISAHLAFVLSYQHTHLRKLSTTSSQPSQLSPLPSHHTQPPRSTSSPNLPLSSHTPQPQWRPPPPPSSPTHPPAFPLPLIQSATKPSNRLTFRLICQRRRRGCS